MSETTPTDTNGDKNAPLPWLAHKGDLSQTPGQPWKLARQGDVLLELSYQYKASDFRRCFSFLNALRVRNIVQLAFLLGLLVAIFVLSINTLSGNFLIGISLFVPVLLGSSMAIFTFIWIGLTLIIPVSGWMLSRIHTKPEQLLATVRGIRFITRDKDTTLEWTQMGNLVLRKGDIYFVSKSLFNDGFYLPRTAFSDTDAANRFHAAVVALWKANGNPDAVSPEAHNEFAPSSPP